MKAKAKKTATKRASPHKAAVPGKAPAQPELVIITGLSGSGKGTVLRALEDMGYYSVDNLPVGLIPKFAELTKESPSVRSAALVVDIREGATLADFPRIYEEVRGRISTKLLFLEADDDVIVRRFSESRRPPVAQRSFGGEKRQSGTGSVGKDPRVGGHHGQHFEAERPRTARSDPRKDPWREA